MLSSDAFGVGMSVRYASTTVKGRAGAKLRTRKETTTGVVAKRQRVQKANATAEEREDYSTTTTSTTTTTASAGRAAGTKKARKSKAKTQPQEDAKQEYDKAQLGEEPSTPPLVVYPQTLVPSSVLDMISTPQQGKTSNGGPASLQLNAIFIWPKAVRAMLVDQKRIQKQKLLLQARHAEEAKIVQPAAALDAAAATATATAASGTHDQSGQEGTNQ